MTGVSQADEESRIAELPAPTLSGDHARDSIPRIWTVFVAYVAAFIGSVLVQIVAVIVLVAWKLTHGVSVSQLMGDLQAMLSTPAALIALGLMAQLVLGLAAIIPARLSTEPARLRLGLVAPGMPKWGYLIIAIGGLVPLALGIALAVALAQVIKPDSSVQRLYEQMTWGWAVPFIWQIGKVLGVFPPTPSLTVTATICAVVLGCFIASVWLLAQGRSQIASRAFEASERSAT